MKKEYTYEETLKKVDDRICNVECAGLTMGKNMDELAKIAKSLASFLGPNGFNYFEMIVKRNKSISLSKTEILKLYISSLKSCKKYTIGTFFYYFEVAAKDEFGMSWDEMQWEIYQLEKTMVYNARRKNT